MRAGCLLRQRDDLANPLLREDWRSFEGASRAALMVALQQQLPPSLMLPERRLEVLVEQALQSQVRQGLGFRAQPHAARCRLEVLLQQALHPQVRHVHESPVWAVLAGPGAACAQASKEEERQARQQSLSVLSDAQPFGTQVWQGYMPRVPKWALACAGGAVPVPQRGAPAAVAVCGLPGGRGPAADGAGAGAPLGTCPVACSGFMPFEVFN